MFSEEILIKKISIASLSFEGVYIVYKISAIVFMLYQVYSFQIIYIIFCALNFLW